MQTFNLVSTANVSMYQSFKQDSIFLSQPIFPGLSSEVGIQEFCKLNFYHLGGGLRFTSASGLLRTCVKILEIALLINALADA